MLATELLPNLQEYLADPAVATALNLPAHGGWELGFLAQGEYNINYLLTSEDGFRQVLRVNVGTQIGKLGGEQIAYEAAALRALDGQGVAPALRYVDASLQVLRYGVLAMEYLPGGPLHYDDPAQIAAAAQTLARLHQTPIPPDHPFVVRRPLHDDLAEARAWLAPYLNCERAPQQLRTIFATLLARAETASHNCPAQFPASRGLVHTDVQAHNFIVDDRRPTTDDRKAQGAERRAKRTTDNGQRTICNLVDWERPLLDDPTYDLAHFLIPTTTQWKCDYTFSPAEREFFLAQYSAARNDGDAADIRARLDLREPFILLRAISWCAGAWVEYTGPGRMIDNRDTLVRIETYLQPAYLRQLFTGWL